MKDAAGGDAGGSPGRRSSAPADAAVGNPASEAAHAPTGLAPGGTANGSPPPAPDKPGNPAAASLDGTASAPARPGALPNPVPPPLIRFRQVSRVYGDGEAEVRALDRIDLTIRRGEFVAIMGASGSGKSTAMNIIGCLDRPTSGEYLFEGVEIGALDRDGRALIRRNYLGFIFQGFNLLPRTSALENVELPLIYKAVPRAERVERARAALAKVGLQGRERHDPSQLSGGQQQRVAIARALAGDPQVVLADEPTGNLDSHRSHEIMGLLQSLNRDLSLTIVMVTHEEDMAAYATRRIDFQDGHMTGDRAIDASVDGATCKDATGPATAPAAGKE